ncbi:MAG: SpoIIIAC/SpoIIIAD family protein [Clostridia bacterium]
MVFFKILGIAFIGVVCYGIVKNVKNELGIFVLLAVGATILIILSDYIVNAISVFSQISTKSGLNRDIFSSIIKIIGIGYIAEYATSICDDAGCKTIAKKIQLGAKLTIFVMTIPIITNIIDIVEGIL